MVFFLCVDMHMFSPKQDYIVHTFLSFIFNLQSIMDTEHLSQGTKYLLHHFKTASDSIVQCSQYPNLI